MKSDPAVFELVSVKSGVQSLRCRTTGEVFHPVVGPMIEARILHVRQQRLIERAATVNGPFIIWDVGLGAAANAIAVIEAFEETDSRIELHSFDQTTEPLRFALEHASELGYLAPHLDKAAGLLTNQTRPGPLQWKLHVSDFRELIKSAPLPAPHAILYDPYSAGKNPGMWTLEHFENLRARLDEEVPCMLTNYTRSTAVRVTLLLAGFFVGHGEGVGEKDQTTVASNSTTLIDKPLNATWLNRVRFSTKGAPLRAGEKEGPIGEKDWTRLLEHPQFRAQNASA
ncbi:MAG: tRNA-guanine transglycosylase [Chthoniobacteraceae bacterium]|nr:tRNA-guanine transglycosylase [Chthoniobacteraceae bacterium]